LTTASRYPSARNAPTADRLRLIGRFLYAIPPSTIGYRQIEPPPLSDLARHRYARCVRSLAELAPAEDADGNLTEHVIKLDAQAGRTLTEFQAWLEEQLRDGGELAGLHDWGGKLAGATVRIAGILHAVAVSGEPWDSPITKPTMESALTLARYLIPHAHAALAMMGEDPAVEDARHVLRWLSRLDGARFTTREALRSVRGTLKSADRVRKALELLAEHDYVRPLDAEQRGPGRRSEAWERTPLGHNGQNGQNK
jgi:hypothetical protein